MTDAEIDIGRQGALSALREPNRELVTREPGADHDHIVTV